ncbi:hypothetical protein O1G21_38905 [Kitasatospora cathayae]|uniref:Uncharacterized protein n=1 Tax=Kitasatospora cathayae TaxID=3004092 RepID=A0ABY7QF69_9ACTN|nr:hypothetical protein [Kitasatospora sp. HUAS 3-15]WBP91267.1 hypothetical protein O1G21_38905 [Kitasatospora sp. HUAS 3-15]
MAVVGGPGTGVGVAAFPGVGVLGPDHAQRVQLRDTRGIEQALAVQVALPVRPGDQLALLRLVGGVEVAVLQVEGGGDGVHALPLGRARVERPQLHRLEDPRRVVLRVDPQPLHRRLHHRRRLLARPGLGDLAFLGGLRRGVLGLDAAGSSPRAMTGL